MHTGTDTPQARSPEHSMPNAHSIAQTTPNIHKRQASWTGQRTLVIAVAESFVYGTTGRPI
ncbi:protein of unknown function [Micropruina glycogenica]|uniref:Uncharacterized protein n=1 Tax=Micropruina glycogenica TaxID=75385 RepID=A0A2N9JEI5_9ACTN|nr:protein of unknown function [Micropruina glycogenica]